MLATSCSFSPRYLRVYFRTRTFSYHIPLSKSGSLTLACHYYLLHSPHSNLINCPKNIFERDSSFARLGPHPGWHISARCCIPDPLYSAFRCHSSLRRFLVWGPVTLWNIQLMLISCFLMIRLMFYILGRNSNTATWLFFSV